MHSLHTATATAVPTQVPVLSLPAAIPLTLGTPAATRFNVTDYDWLGFDLDHTLITYKQPAFNIHMLRAAARAMIESAASHAAAFGSGAGSLLLR